jgi:hypothetical protein
VFSIRKTIRKVLFPFCSHFFLGEDGGASMVVAGDNFDHAVQNAKRAIHLLGLPSQLKLQTLKRFRFTGLARARQQVAPHNNLQTLTLTSMTSVNQVSRQVRQPSY